MIRHTDYQTIECNCSNEVAFAKSVFALTEALGNEWSKKVGELKKVYQVNQSVTQQVETFFAPDNNTRNTDEPSIIFTRRR